jgi:SAM-dependent methyltransferase
MPIRPNRLEQLLFFTLNQGPAALLDLWSAVAFRVVVAAVRLGVFEAMVARPLTALEAAETLQADARGMTVLLDALVTLGYVKKQGERFENCSTTSKWLVESAPANFAPYLRFWDVAIHELWDTLEDSIRTGESPTRLYEWIEGHPDTSRDFQEGMIAIAQSTGAEAIGRLSVPDTARRVLDVGGGHATYSVLLCRRYPGIAVTVFDSPEALCVGRDNVPAELAHRIEFREGDFTVDELGRDYDVALLFNIVHGFSPAENLALFRKVARTLTPGGHVVVLEQVAGKMRPGAGGAINQLLAVSYFHLLGGQVYSFNEVSSWLAAAGFTDTRRKNLLRTPGSSLIIATIPE